MHAAADAATRPLRTQ